MDKEETSIFFYLCDSAKLWHNKLINLKNILTSFWIKENQCVSTDKLKKVEKAMDKYVFRSIAGNWPPAQQHRALTSEIARSEWYVLWNTGDEVTSQCIYIELSTFPLLYSSFTNNTLPAKHSHLTFQPQAATGGLLTEILITAFGTNSGKARVGVGDLDSSHIWHMRWPPPQIV